MVEADSNEKSFVQEETIEKEEALEGVPREQTKKRENIFRVYIHLCECFIHMVVCGVFGYGFSSCLTFNQIDISCQQCYISGFFVFISYREGGMIILLLLQMMTSLLSSGSIESLI